MDRTSQILEHIHTDICELNRMLYRDAIGILFPFDYYSRYMYDYVIKHMHETFDIFKTYKK